MSFLLLASDELVTATLTANHENRIGGVIQSAILNMEARTGSAVLTVPVLLHHEAKVLVESPPGGGGTPGGEGLITITTGTFDWWFLPYDINDPFPATPWDPDNPSLGGGIPASDTPQDSIMLDTPPLTTDEIGEPGWVSFAARMVDARPRYAAGSPEEPTRRMAAWADDGALTYAYMTSIPGSPGKGAWEQGDWRLHLVMTTIRDPNQIEELGLIVRAGLRRVDATGAFVEGAVVGSYATEFWAPPVTLGQFFSGQITFEWEEVPWAASVSSDRVQVILEFEGIRPATTFAPMTGFVWGERRLTDISCQGSGVNQVCQTPFAGETVLISPLLRPGWVHENTTGSGAQASGALNHEGMVGVLGGPAAVAVNHESLGPPTPDAVLSAIHEALQGLVTGGTGASAPGEAVIPHEALAGVLTPGGDPPNDGVVATANHEALEQPGVPWRRQKRRTKWRTPQQRQGAPHKEE